MGPGSKHEIQYSILHVYASVLGVRNCFLAWFRIRQWKVYCSFNGSVNIEELIRELETFNLVPYYINPYIFNHMDFKTTISLKMNNSKVI